MKTPGTRPLETIADTMIGLAVLLGGLAPIILAIELVEWGVTGQWPGWSVEDGLMLFGLEPPLARFDLTQFALDIVTDLPLALGLQAMGLICFSLAVNVVDPLPTTRPRKGRLP